MKQSDILKAEALALYREADAIYAGRIWVPRVMQAYLDKVAEADAASMRFNDAILDEMRAAAETQEAA